MVTKTACEKTCDRTAVCPLLWGYKWLCLRRLCVNGEPSSLMSSPPSYRPDLLNVRSTKFPLANLRKDTSSGYFWRLSELFSVRLKLKLSFKVSSSIQNQIKIHDIINMISHTQHIYICNLVTSCQFEQVVKCVCRHFRKRLLSAHWGDSILDLLLHRRRKQVALQNETNKHWATSTSLELIGFFRAFFILCLNTQRRRNS